MGITRSDFHFNRISLTAALRGQRELMVEVRSLEAIRKQFSIYFGLKTEVLGGRLLSHRPGLGWGSGGGEQWLDSG